MENGIIIRIFVVILLSLAIFFYFLLNNNDIEQIFKHNKTESLKYSLADVDSTVDKVLSKFHISKNQMKRNEIRFAETDFVRIEKRINVLNDSLSLLINLELKQMMDDYGLKVSGTENLKEKITTLYIIDKGTILQSIGFKSKK
ncbi:MAG: hypothetical protein Q8K98_11450 [Bacteroidota bacterium]|nr:hypothetical protein [Bacteroidota bacterium]